MDTKKLKELIEHKKKRMAQHGYFFIQDREDDLTLLDIAQLVVEASERLPKKKKCPVRYPDTRDFRNGYDHGFDKAIDDCTLAIAKRYWKKVEREELVKMLEDEMNNKLMNIDVMSNGQCAYELAQTIIERLEKEI